MNKIAQIFGRDCRRLARSPIAMIVLIGATILPCLYAWLNVGAYTDPYQYTSGLRVAIVSNDRGVQNEMTGALNAGEKVIENLKENDSLGWVFTSEKKAIRGVKSGKYYAAIVIPESFSEDLLSITTGELRQPVLEYYLNEKKNAMAPMILNVGANSIQNQINQQFIDAAVEAVSGIAQSMIDDLGLQLSTVQQSLTDDMAEVSDNLTQYESMIQDLQQLVSDNRDFDQNIRDTMNGISITAASGRETVDDASQTLRDGRDRMASFSADLNRNLRDGRDLLDDVRHNSNLDFQDLNTKTQAVGQKVDLSIQRLQNVADWNAGILEDLTTLSQYYPDSVADGLLQRVRQENQNHIELLQALRTGHQALGDTATNTLDFASTIQTDLSDSRNSLSGIQDSWTQNLQPSFQQTLDQVAYLLGRTGSALEPVDGQIHQMESVLDGLNQSMDEIDRSVSDTEQALSRIREQIDNTITDLDILSHSEEYQKLLSASIDGQQLSGFVASPVSLKTETFFKVRNYGTAMSPFFTNLSLWVGGIVLLALFKIEVDTDEEIPAFRPFEGYIGRGILFVLAGQAQALTVCLGDLFMMKIQCEHPFLFILSGMMASLVYVSLIYALGTTLRHIGKALCIIILIFQVPACSGTYPVEMTSRFFRALHPILPFTYGVSAMREAEIGIYGHHYALAMIRLSLFLTISLILGLGLRPFMINLNVLFDKKLAETDLMICDEGAQEQERFRLMAAIRLLAGRDRFRENASARIRHFETVYQKRIRQSFRITLIILPLIFLTLMFVFGGSRILFLILWILSLIALMLFQILVEYFREHLDRQQRMAEMSDQDLLKLLNRRKEPGVLGDSDEPKSPTDPKDATDSENPEAPDDSESPEEPGNPEESESPDDPGHPKKTEEPDNSGECGNPEVPDHPTESGHSERSKNPEESEHPAESEHPEGSEDPESPTVPEESELPEHPEKGA